MYKYVAVTSGKIENSSEILRIAEDGSIEQFDIDLNDWREADAGMSGIYCGEIESETISKTQADEVIRRWRENADKSV